MKIIVTNQGTITEIDDAPGAASVSLNLDENTVQINNKGPYPLARVGYQALYGVSLTAGDDLDGSEVNALRTAIHRICRDGFIPGALADRDLPMDLFIGSTKELPLADAALSYGVHTYADTDTLKTLVMPSHLTPTPAQPAGSLLINTLEEAFTRMDGSEIFYQNLMEFIKKNNPHFIEQWFPEVSDAPKVPDEKKDAAILELLKKIVHPGVTLALACSETNPTEIWGICLNHGSGSGIHFPHFLAVKEDQRDKKIGSYLISQVGTEGTSIAISSAQVVVNAASKKMMPPEGSTSLVMAPGPESSFKFYQYPINEISAELALNAVRDPVEETSRIMTAGPAP